MAPVPKFMNATLPKPQEPSNLINIWSTLPNVPVRRSSIPTPPQSPKFNPDAPSFVPSWNGATHHHQYVQSATVRPAWLHSFWLGTATASSNEQATHAQALVAHLGEPNGAALAELAQHFCYQASMPESNGVTVAAFAKAVYTTVQAGRPRGDWAAKSFKFHLLESVKSIFTACWTLNQTTPSPPLSLCAFIGQLYAHSLLPSSAPRDCLTHLSSELQTFACINYLYAIHTLLQHSSESLWRGEEAGQRLRDLAVRIGQRVSVVGKWACVGGGGMISHARKEEADKVFKDITNMLNRWQGSRYIPAGEMGR